VKEPNDAVRVGDRVTVRVMSVDVPRKRIALSMKTQGATKPAGGGGGRPSASQQGGAGKPGQGKPGPSNDASRDRKPAPPPRAPEPPKPGVAPNGMRITTRK
jgi:uncharacterized protein